MFEGFARDRKTVNGVEINFVLGGDGPVTEVFDLTAAGRTRANSLDLPPEAAALLSDLTPHNYLGHAAMLARRD